MNNARFKKELPKGWQELCIGDIANPINCLNIDRRPYVVFSCTKHDGLVPSLQYFGRKVYGNNLQKYKVVPFGCFAYATNHVEEGSIGYQGFLDFGLVSPMYTVFKIKNGVSDIDPLYFLQLLKSPTMIRRYKSMMTASVERRGGLRWSTFSKIKVIIPSIQEQKKIVNLTTKYNIFIQKVAREAEVIKLVKQALTQGLLAGRIKFEGYTNEWKSTVLSDVLTEHKQTSSGDEEVHSVSVSKGLVNQIEHLGRSYAAKDTSKYKLVKPGDVIYTKSPTGDYPYGIIKQSKINYSAIVSPLYGVFTPENYSIGTILDAYFESPNNTAKYLRPLVHKGAKNTMNITNDTFLSGKIFLPTDIRGQKMIASLLNIFAMRAECINKKLSLISKQKKYLTEKVLKGEILIPHDLNFM